MPMQAMFSLSDLRPIIRGALLLLNLVMCAAPAVAQQQTQAVRGTVVDADTQLPLVGVNVVLEGGASSMAATTDLEGRFILDRAPVGRITLRVFMLGYTEQTLANLLVNSAKELVLEIRLQEALNRLQEVVVSDDRPRGEVRNDMAMLSARTISVEETSRIAGGINDPARMVSVFPGVANDPTGNNTIMVRGNSPNGVLWRLEGLEVPNPNHFADDGSTGGPINVLNSDVVANSEFYTGGFSAEYGNVTSAVFDMRLRDGNDRRREHTFKVGVLGTDLTTEGPMPGLKGGSYLANYRYSTLSLLDAAGIVDYQGVPNYTDAAFKLKFPRTKAGTFTVFGVGGRSSIRQRDEGVTGDTLFAESTFGSRVGVVAVTNTVSLGDNNYLYSAVSLSGNGSGTTYHEAGSMGETPLELRHEDDLARWTVRASSTLNTRISSAHRLRSGIIVSVDRFRMYANSYDREEDRMNVELDQRGAATTVQAFTSWKWRWSEAWSLTSGVHVLHFGLTGRTSVEPRAAVRYQQSPARVITLGGGLHGRRMNLMDHLAWSTDAEGARTQPNRDLGFSKSAHAVLGYEQLLAEDVQVKAELYYQHLYDQPVEDRDGSAFWLGNTEAWYTTKDLVNEGIGRNMGAEVSVEKFFTRGWHALATASVFESRYRAQDGTWYNARFGLGAVGNVLAGKEWKVSATKDKVILTGVRYSVQGGQWRTPIDLEASIATGQQQDGSPAMSVKGPPIHKVDMVLAYRIGGAKVSHELKADVQNVLNARTPVQEYYDQRTRTIRSVDQLAILPVLQYTLRF